MAALQALSGGGSALTYATPTGDRLRKLAGVPFWLVILAVLYASGAASDAGFLFLVGLFAVYQVLSGLAAVFSDTRVRIDPTSRTITRSQRVIGVPVSTTALDFGQVSRLEVVQTRASVRADQARPPSYQVQAVRKNGSPLVINWDGTRDEMVQLAQRVAKVSHISFQDEMAPTPAVGLSPSFPPPSPAWPVLQQDAAPTEVFQPQTQRRTEASLAPLPVSMPSGVVRSGETSTAMPLSFQSPLMGGGMALSPVMGGTEAVRPVMTGETQRAVSAEYQPAVFAGSALMTAPLSGVVGVALGAPVLSAPLTSAAPVSLAREPASTTMTAPDAGLSQPMPVRSTRDWRRQNMLQLQEAVRADPTDVDAWAELARRNMDARRWARARDAYLDWFKNDSLNASIQNDLGISYLMLGQAREAEAAFNRAIALDPFGVRPRLNLALLCLRTGRRDRAMAILNEAGQYANDDSARRAVEAVRRGRTPSLFRSGG